MVVDTNTNANTNRPPSTRMGNNGNALMQSPLLLLNDMDMGDIPSSSRKTGDGVPITHDFPIPFGSSLILHDDERRGIRGRVVSRATQDISRSGNATTSSIPSVSSGATTAVESDSHFVMTIVCVVIISPCILAVVAQIVFTYQKRKKARIEQQLLAVSTNPTSRMLILSEILKNDCRVS